MPLVTDVQDRQRGQKIPPTHPDRGSSGVGKVLASANKRDQEQRAKEEAEKRARDERILRRLNDPFYQD